MALFALPGCSRSEPVESITGNAADDKLVSEAVEQMMQPSSPQPGWPVAGEPAEALGKLTEHVQQQFAAYQEVEELIYPDGWVKRVLEPLDVKLEPPATSTDATLVVTYQKKSTIIHPTREAAEADADLLPYPSAQSKEQMTGPLKRPWPPVKVTIEYELRETDDQRRWVRTGWTTEPEVIEGDDFLDRIGVP